MTRTTGAVPALARALAVCAALGPAACGGDDHAPIVGGDDDDEPSGDDDVVDASDGLFDAGATPDAPVDADGPVVALLAPTEPEPGDYSSEAIVTRDRVQAVCSATPNLTTGESVDAASIAVSARSGELSVEAMAAPTGIADQYTAILEVGDLPNGPIEIRCTASDLASDPHTNSAAVVTYLDLGPRIDVVSPIAGTSYGQELNVVFTVSEEPVAEGDTGAAVTDVQLTAGSTPIALTSMGGGSYTATIDFDAPVFDPPLDGLVALTVRATNHRTESAVTRAALVPFVADSTGPTLQIAEPAAGVLVGGFMEISVDASDPAGIDAVIATVAHEFEVDLVAISATTFTATFDTRLLDTSWVFPLIEVRARDRVGNQSAVGRTVALDNRAPLVTLDSPLMREARCLIGDVCSVSGAICSALFDPLGSDAADDGEVVGALTELRARAEDRGNGALAPGGVVVPMAGVEDAGVALYILDDSSGTLLVDTDGDTLCDAIDPSLIPTSVPDTPNEAAVVSLVAVSPAGAPPYPVTSGPFGALDEVADDNCDDPGVEADTTPPGPLCISSPATRVPATDQGGPIVFAMPPTVDPWCVGGAFDAPATHIADGWACVVAVAPDGLGNLGLSPPLRLCIDHDGDRLDDSGTPLVDLGCGVGGDDVVDFGDIAPAENRPLCTDGCTIPETFADFPSMQVRVTGGL